MALTYIVTVTVRTAPPPVQTHAAAAAIPEESLIAHTHTPISYVMQSCFIDDNAAEETNILITRGKRETFQKNDHTSMIMGKF